MLELKSPQRTLVSFGSSRNYLVVFFLDEKMFFIFNFFDQSNWVIIMEDILMSSETEVEKTTLFL